MGILVVRSSSLEDVQESESVMAGEHNLLRVLKMIVFRSCVASVRYVLHDNQFGRDLPPQVLLVTYFTAKVDRILRRF